MFFLMFFIIDKNTLKNYAYTIVIINLYIGKDIVFGMCMYAINKKTSHKIHV
jgi:hypothetical protein